MNHQLAVIASSAMEIAVQTKYDLNYVRFQRDYNFSNKNAKAALHHRNIL